MTNLTYHYLTARGGGRASFQMRNGELLNLRLRDNPTNSSMPKALTVKRGRLGLLGEKLFELHDAMQLLYMSNYLKLALEHTVTPADLWDLNMQPLANAILHCDTAEEVRVMLHSAAMAASEIQAAAEAESPSTPGAP